MNYLQRLCLNLVFTSGSLFAFFATVAQPPILQWQKCIGGSKFESGRSICQTNDGGFIIVGYTASDDGDVTGLHGTQYDYWIVKTSATGIIQWQKTLGGSGSDLANSIAQTYDNGYIVAGYSYSNDSDVTGNHGNADYWVVKTDDTGAIQWQRSFGGSNIDIATAVQQTSDSGYIVAGRSSSNDGDVLGYHDSADCWILKLSSSGSIQWQRSLGGSRGDGAVAIQQTMDTGFVIACTSNSVDGDVTGNHGNYDLWIVKLSFSGAIQWQKSLGGSGNDYAGDVQQTSDSGFIVLGSSNSTDGDVTGNHGGLDYWALKLSSTGNIQWQKSLGGSSDDFGYSIKQTIDTGYIAAGISFSNDIDVTVNYGISDMWLTKLSASGSLEWQKSLGGSTYDGAACVVQTTDSCYIIAGYSDSNDFLVTGNHGGSDYWVVKLCDSSNSSTLRINMAGANVADNGTIITVAPNPASQQIMITSTNEISHVTISNLLGQIVYGCNYTTRQVVMNIANLPAGMYLINVNDTDVTKFIKE